MAHTRRFGGRWHSCVGSMELYCSKATGVFVVNKCPRGGRGKKHSLWKLCVCVEIIIFPIKNLDQKKTIYISDLYIVYIYIYSGIYYRYIYIPVYIYMCVRVISTLQRSLWLLYQMLNNLSALPVHQMRTAKWKKIMFVLSCGKIQKREKIKEKREREKRSP